jgi:hypothetical protein
MTVKERPILFSAPMVRAILDGKKSVTRRAIKLRPPYAMDEPYVGTPWPYDTTWSYGDQGSPWMPCPYGKVGDRLWVRETFHRCPHCAGDLINYRAGGWLRLPSGSPDDGGDRNDVDYHPLNYTCFTYGWRPSVHMPREASRITLEITGVRVERLREITDADARAEGVNGVEEFEGLWRSINGHGSWDANLYVWVVEFKRVEI